MSIILARFCGLVTLLCCYSFGSGGQTSSGFVGVATVCTTGLAGEDRSLA
ncbi:hypothetical protein B1R32_13412 [Abditibacterium utsteinense]|uniref:Uncharacterized protein n=1 Tax=Abditibacterium utsteinense TaxID=1960156 RepID=A0A2S8SNT1_9BACT|nr:hypothetical protein B1R32_13412 [Abditibacterium utsteinense]